jgi:hypothetical protein
VALIDESSLADAISLGKLRLVMSCHGVQSSLGL